MSDKTMHPPVGQGSGSQPGVIWITGFSGAGKTTVARKVKSSLQEMGGNIVLLDGDDLRRIFADKWGYSRSERIELAHAYFRLCNTLAAQGATVVIAAVAMYEEIFNWVRDNIDVSLQIYLRVPECERVMRDSRTKRLYASIGDAAKLYDEPSSPDLLIDNYGETSAEGAAEAIVNTFRTMRRGTSNKGRAEHWDQYYKSPALLFTPSSFAVAVGRELEGHGLSILDVGCGNGRDSAYFAELGHTVIAIDPSAAAIALCKSKFNSGQIRFHKCALPDLKSSADSFDVIYSRFCLHAMTETEEIDTLRAAYQALKRAGRLFIECRSINDPLSRKGEVISPTERIYGHYRRFIILDDLKKRLTDVGFRISSTVEAADLAVLGDDNPVVLRVQAVK